MRILLSVLAVFFITVTGNSQIRTPAPSPGQTIKQDFGLSSIEVDYSRPGVKGRKVFGDLVPYGAMWRTGANGATKITFGDDVTIGGKEVKAGSYALYTIPLQAEFEVILNKGVNNGGLAGYSKDDDVTRFKVKSETIPNSVENFTINFQNVKANSLDVVLTWDKTRVAIPVTTDIDKKIMAQIDESINKDTKPYFQAAMYYLDNDKDLNQAVSWFDKAIAQNPNGYWIYHQKANALVKLNKKEDAKKAALKSMEIAKQEKNDDYVRLNEKLIAGL